MSLEEGERVVSLCPKIDWRRKQASPPVGPWRVAINGMLGTQPHRSVSFWEPSNSIFQTRASRRIQNGCVDRPHRRMLHAGLARVNPLALLVRSTTSCSDAYDTKMSQEQSGWTLIAPDTVSSVVTQTRVRRFLGVGSWTPENDGLEFCASYSEDAALANHAASSRSVSHYRQRRS